MANQGAKKRKEENVRHMVKVRRLIIACNVFGRCNIYHLLRVPYTYLAIPVFGSYKASDLIGGFIPQGSEGGVGDEKFRRRERRRKGNILKVKSSRQEQDESVGVEHNILGNILQMYKCCQQVTAL